MMSVEVPVVLNAAQGSPRPSASIRHDVMSGGEVGGGLGSGAVGGDVGVPGLAGGDDGMQVSQDRGGDHGLGLGWLELVVLAGGQVPVAGSVDGGGALGSPDGSPGRDPEPWSALAGELGPAGEGSR